MLTSIVAGLLVGAAFIPPPQQPEPTSSSSFITDSHLIHCVCSQNTEYHFSKIRPQCAMNKGTRAFPKWEFMEPEEFLRRTSGGVTHKKSHYIFNGYGRCVQILIEYK